MNKAQTSREWSPRSKAPRFEVSIVQPEYLQSFFPASSTQASIRSTTRRPSVRGPYSPRCCKSGSHVTLSHCTFLVHLPTNNRTVKRKQIIPCGFEPWASPKKRQHLFLLLVSVFPELRKRGDGRLSESSLVQGPC